MSAPAGKPFDLSFYPTDRERDRGEHKSGGDQAAFVSPYAPKRASARTAGETSAAPTGSDRPPPGERDRDDPPAPAPTPPAAPVDLDAVAAARRQAPESTPALNRTPAGRGERTFGDQDAERLEASLRWLQREEAASRLLHGDDRLATHTPLEAGERMPPSLRRPLPPRSLEPERMAPPPQLGSRRSYWPLYVLFASAVGAGAAYLVAVPDRAPSPVQTPLPQVASFETRPAAPAPVVRERQSLLPTVARDEDAGAGAVNESTRQAQPLKSTRIAKLPDPAPPEVMAAPPAAPPITAATPAAPSAAASLPAPPAAAPSVPPAAAAPPPPETAATAPAREPSRTLDPEAIKLLIKQGGQFVAAGDLVTARTVFQRAAEAGDANAAMALAATYDPLMLTKLGVVGMAPDVEKARTWYQRAASLGLQEASRRLSLLANQ